MRMRTAMAAALCCLIAAGALADGKCGDKAKKVAFKDLPAAVQKTITDNAAGGKVAKVMQEVENGATEFSATVKRGGGKGKLKVSVAADGTLVGTEEKVKLADVPEPVRKKIGEIAAGKKIKSVARCVEGGKETFEVSIKGVKGETVIAPDGTVVPEDTAAPAAAPAAAPVAAPAATPAK